MHRRPITQRATPVRDPYSRADCSQWGDYRSGRCTDDYCPAHRPMAYAAVMSRHATDSVIPARPTLNAAAAQS